MEVITQNGYQYVNREKPWQYQEGEYTVTRGNAWSGPGCHLGCAVVMYTDKDGKLVKVEGDPESQYTKGRLCVRCLALPEVTNSPLRLTYPMKRARENRGKDLFERISWEEAFDTIEANLNKVKEEYGAESVMFSQGTGRDVMHYFSRLCYSFGSPTYCSLFSGNACYLPRVAGLIATTGAFWVADASNQFIDRFDNPQYVVPEVMFIWGNNPLRSNSDGFFGHTVVDLMKRGMKIVMIDPKVTWLSVHAEMHLRVRPGTDAALALAMLNVIINEDIYDHDFVDRWCYGLDELRERVQQYTPEAMTATTGVPAEQITAAARLLATSKPACLQWGVAVDMTREGLPAAQAILGLFEITGNMDIPGGMVAPPDIMNYGMGWSSDFEGNDLVSEEQANKRIGLDTYALLRFGFRISHPDLTFEAIKTGKPFPIKAAFVMQSNILACMAPKPEEVKDVLAEKLDFIVCAEIFMTPTVMALADIVLPAATFPERDGLRFGDGMQRGETINKVTQIGECKSDMEICLELGRRFNPSAWPWDNARDMFDYMISSKTGMSFEEVRDKAPVYLPFEYKKYEKGMLRPDGQPGFRTETGRIELFSTFFQMAELDPLPYFEEPSPGPLSTPELLAEYPYVLTTGARHWGTFHTEHRQIP
ncbi:MAG: molybdopterin-dependent oxidoreductase, partial [Eggerthellaceae bacterium]|nr:molybdopterin-dependent oxidoreductase [Eggerthellaceae bacterium]